MLFSLAFALVAAKPEVVVQVGPGTQLRSVALSADGKLALSSGHDASAKLWDVDKQVILRSLYAGNVSSQVQFMPGGKHALTNYLFDLETGKVLPGSWSGRFFALSPDGKHGAYDQGDKIFLVKTADLGVVHTLEGTRVAFSPDGKEAVTGNGAELKFWNTATGAKTATIKIPTESFTGVYWAADGTIIAQGNGYEAVGYTRTGQRLWTLQGQQFMQSGDGRTLIACGNGGFAVFNASSGTRGASFAPANDCRAFNVSFDGRRVIHGDYETLTVYDVKSGAATPLRAQGTFARAMIVAPDDHTVASGGDDGLIRLWDSSTAQLVDQATGATGDRAHVTSLRYSKDGKVLVSGHQTGEVVVWDLSPLRERTRTVTCKDAVNSLVVGEGFVYASCGGFWIRDAGYLFRWDYAKNEPARQVMKSPEPEAYGLELSPKADIVYWRQYKQLFALRTATGEEVFKTQLTGGALSISNDGKTLLTQSLDETTYVDSVVWLDAMTGKETRKCVPTGGPKMFRGLQPSNDPKTLTAMDYFTAYRIDATTCAMTAVGNHSGVVTSVAMLNGGKQMASASKNESTIRLWDVAAAKEQVQLLAIRQGGYVSITPDFYYVSSKEATRAITFTIGMVSYAYDLFDLRLNRPDIVAERLGAAKATVDLFRAAVDKRLKKQGFKRDSFGDDFVVPELKVVDSANADGVELVVSAKDAKGLDRLLVSVNGVPLKSRGETLGRATSAKKTVRVPLNAGANKLQVSVLNAAGIESERVVFDRAGPSASKSTLYVVAIGVSKYKQSEYNLDYAAKDARDMAELLATEKGRYADVSIDVLTDEEVTREKVRALKAKVAATHVDDAVIVFVAGHGLLDDKLDYYLATHDVAFDKPADKGLAWADLEALVEDIPARRRLLLIDACHSGEVDKDEVTTSAPKVAVAQGEVHSRGVKAVQKKVTGAGSKPISALVQELFVDLSHGTGANVLSSATGTQYAFESKEWSNGVFTFALIEALKARQADGNKDQRVTLDELRGYVPPRVGQLTSGRQTPTARSLNPLVDLAL